MQDFDQDDKSKLVREFIKLHTEYLFVLLKEHYESDTQSLKSVFEEVGIECFWRDDANASRIISDFLRQQCSKILKTNHIYDAFRLFNERLNHFLLREVFYYIHTILFRDAKEADRETRKINYTLFLASRFQKIQKTREILGILNKRQNASDICSEASCQLQSHTIQVAKGIRQFDKISYDTLYLIQMLNSIYEKIDQLFETERFKKHLPSLDDEIQKLYDNTISYILVESPDKIEDVNKEIKAFLKSRIADPKTHDAIDIVMDGLKFIHENYLYSTLFEKDGYPNNKNEGNENLVFKKIHRVFDNIPSIVEDIAEKVQVDLELSAIALNLSIIPLEKKEGKPPFKIKERLVSIRFSKYYEEVLSE